MKLTTYLQLVPRLRRCGFVHPLPMCLHGIVLNYLSVGTTLPLPPCHWAWRLSTQWPAHWYMRILSVSLLVWSWVAYISLSPAYHFSFLLCILRHIYLARTIADLNSPCLWTQPGNYMNQIRFPNIREVFPPQTSFVTADPVQKIISINLIYLLKYL
jgi:hypothetical protein